MQAIDYYKPESISEIREVWEALEQGPDMTYFQTYHWHEMLAKVCVVQENWVETVVAVVKNDGKAIMIAPLIIVKKTHRLVNKKGVYFWGRKGWSDYLNLIYDDFSTDGVDFLITSIHDKYGVGRFMLEQLRKDTALYRYFENKQVKAVAVSSTSCVALQLPETIEAYQKMLSKHSRQNIRTAKNRLAKDGIDLTFCYDDDKVDKEICRQMREVRVIAKQNALFQQKSLPRKIGSKIKQGLTYKYPSYLPFCSDEDSKMLTVYDGDTLCGFFNYGIDKHHKTIVLMAVGTNERYARYSPGILALYSFICSKIEEKNIVCFDFTRGDEPYKFALGGGDFLIYNIEYEVGYT